MREIIVTKYGGTSITSAQDIEQVKRITEDDPQRRVVVVSAPGKRHDNDVKVTDMLIHLAEVRNKNSIPTIIERYKLLAPERKMNDLKKDLEERYMLDAPKEAYLDALKAFGEEACAKIIAEKLKACYLDPKELFLVSNNFGNAKILPESEQLIKAAIDGKKIVVVPGFYGYTKEGQKATFSRGGSDLTGAYLAAALDAIVYENFTDRVGILAADPTLVENPKKIDELTFKEIRDLAYSGFTIFHHEAMGPLEKKLIPIHVRKTESYPGVGTYVVHDRISDAQKPVVGVAYQNGFCSFNIDRFGLNEEEGIVQNLLAIFADEKVPLSFFSNAIDDITVIVREESVTKKVGRISTRLYAATEATIKFQEHLGCLVVAGKGLKGRRGISAEIQNTLALAGVNITFISQGSQERCIVYGIDRRDGKKAVTAVYDKYIR